MNFTTRIYFAPNDGNGNDGGNPPADQNQQQQPNTNPPAPPEWLNALPDDLKADDRLKAIPDIGTLAGRFAKAIELPGDDARPEDRDAALDAIANRLGRPEKAEGYQVPEVKDRPYTDEDKALQAAFLPIAHAARMTQAQVDAVVKFNNELTEKAIATQTKAYAETEAGLREKLGDKFDEKLELANRAVAGVLEKAGIKLDDFRQMKLSNGSYWGDSPMANALFIGIGELIGETKFVPGGGHADGGGERVDPKSFYPNSQHN